MELLSHKKTKEQIGLVLFIKPKAKNVKWEKKKRCSGQTWSNSRERTSDFSLEYRAIRPSAVFETRRKAALRGEGFAWVPDLGSFLKLREVGVSPYLGFIPSLSILSMFESNEAVKGRLIGPKP